MWDSTGMWDAFNPHPFRFCSLPWLCVNYKVLRPVLQCLVGVGRRVLVRSSWSPCVPPSWWSLARRQRHGSCVWSALTSVLVLFLASWLLRASREPGVLWSLRGYRGSGDWEDRVWSSKCRVAIPASEILSWADSPSWEMRCFLFSNVLKTSLRLRPCVDRRYFPRSPHIFQPVSISSLEDISFLGEKSEDEGLTQPQSWLWTRTSLVSRVFP